MNPIRRLFLKCNVTFAALTVVAGAGLLKTTQAVAAAWNKSGFESKAAAEAS